MYVRAGRESAPVCILAMISAALSSTSGQLASESTLSLAASCAQVSIFPSRRRRCFCTSHIVASPHTRPEELGGCLSRAAET